MSLKNSVNNLCRIFGFKIEKTIASFGNNMAVYNLPKSHYSIKQNDITFHQLNLVLPLKNAYSILEGYADALNLSRKNGVRFFTDEQANANVEVDGIKFAINDKEELYILSEIFLEGSYNLLPSTGKKVALIDIGMNVGITSLFFASKPEVEKVFSFEPFTPTYNMALKNFALNQPFSGKINPNNFGVAQSEGKLTIPYSTRQKGRMGLRGVPNTADITAKDVEQQDILLKPVAEQFEKIAQQVNDNFIVCKMDCEGAEYEIIDALFNNNLLALPNVYFIEWHLILPTEIISKLQKSNYHVIATTFKDKQIGMIYAVKS